MDRYLNGSVPFAHVATDLAIHSSECLETFHCSSAVSDWWSIATWANGRHSFEYLLRS